MLLGNIMKNRDCDKKYFEKNRNFVAFMSLMMDVEGRAWTASNAHGPVAFEPKGILTAVDDS